VINYWDWLQQNCVLKFTKLLNFPF
jgi:hypothetical protein